MSGSRRERREAELAERRDKRQRQRQRQRQPASGQCVAYGLLLIGGWVVATLALRHSGGPRPEEGG